MNEEISIGDLVNEIKALMGIDIKIISDTSRIRPDNSEVERLKCDNSKLLKFTNWKPKFDLKLGLEETIEWMKSNLRSYKPFIYNV